MMVGCSADSWIAEQSRAEQCGTQCKGGAGLAGLTGASCRLRRGIRVTREKGGWRISGGLGGGSSESGSATIADIDAVTMYGSSSSSAQWLYVYGQEQRRASQPLSLCPMISLISRESCFSHRLPSPARGFRISRLGRKKT